MAEKVTPLYYENNIKKFDDMINFKIAKFMLDFDKNKLLNYINDYWYFCKTLQVHTWFIRSSEKHLLYLPRFQTGHLQRSIKFRGQYGTIFQIF